MRDRQVFATKKLPNGITIHEYATGDPFVIFSIFIPIGTVHNGTNTPNGTAHFYEHMTMHRSTAYPEKDAFVKWIGSIGGDINAQTLPFSTTYVVQVATQYAKEAWQGLFSLVFEPLFTEDDLVIERGIVKNEREQRRWYPGDSEVSNFLWSNWITAEVISKQQLFGNDEDLATISIPVLQSFKHTYRNPNVHIVVAGNTDVTYIEESMSAIQTTSSSIPEIFQPFEWRQKQFFTHQFTDIDSPIYFTAVHHQLPNNQDRIALQFLFEYMTDIYAGPLYDWLRHEKGWSYSLDWSRIVHKYGEVLVLEIPLQDTKQVEAVRNELPKRIEQAISDDTKLAAAVRRQLGETVFFYQTLEQIVTDALHDIEHYGAPLCESDFKAFKQKCADPTYMQGIYQKYFSSGKRGEFCAIPK